MRPATKPDARTHRRAATRVARSGAGAKPAARRGTCALCGAPFQPGDRRPLVTLYDGLRFRPVQRHVCATCYADAARDYGGTEARSTGRLGVLRPATF